MTPFQSTPPATHLEMELAKGVRQSYRWVNSIEYIDSQDKKHLINVLEYLETKPSTATKFKWLTNFTLLSRIVPVLANQAGRLRWKIENEGFNVQKK